MFFIGLFEFDFNKKKWIILITDFIYIRKREGSLSIGCVFDNESR
jgi:hypothetical protein